MKILQLCKKFPYPLKDGESIAITNLSRSLTESGCRVDLLAMNTSRHFVELSQVNGALDHYENVYAVEVDNRIKPLEALGNLIKGKSYHISRFESNSFKENLIKLLKREKYDVIQLETLYLTPYIDIIRKYSKGLVSMRAHNIEHEIWDKIAKNTKLLPKRWYLKKLTQQLKDYEVKHLNDFDFLIAISDRDLIKFKNMGYHNGAVSTPVGINLSAYGASPTKEKVKPELSFIGSLDWMPNLEGLQWFLDKVMPSLNEVELHVAGRNTPDSLKSNPQNNVVIHGEVDSAQKFINSYPIMVVPLLSGSGMRVKILEGMALGKLVITTSKGVEGIGATDGINVLLADTAEQFIEKIKWAVSNPERSNSIGQAARSFISSEYDSVEIAKKLKLAYEYVLSSDYVSK